MARRALSELRLARATAGISQRTLARHLALSQPEISRLESDAAVDVSVVRLAETGAVLGLELALTLHPVAPAIRDKGTRR